MNVDVVDVVIIGGGPAGCAVALSLKRNSQNVSCLVLDNADPSDFKIGESLPPESRQLLGFLDPSFPKQLSDKVASGIHTSCSGNASAWSSPIPYERHSILNPLGEGYHLNRSDFDESLRSSVVNRGSAPDSSLWLQKCTFKKLEKSPEGLWVIEVEAGGAIKKITTKWVVDATGRKASVATKLDSRIVANHPLLAFYGIFIAELDGVDDDRDRDTRTMIEATAEGWWYTSLISHSPSTRIVVFHTLPTHPAAKASRRPDSFLDRLYATSPEISSIIGKWDYNLKPSYPRCTSASSSYLDRPFNCAGRWAAVGDAAMAFDPLSSQGMMTALEMGRYLGFQLSQRLEDKITDAEFDHQLGEVYANLRANFEKSRKYYYSIVTRFAGEEFWEGVSGSQ